MIKDLLTRDYSFIVFILSFVALTCGLIFNLLPIVSLISSVLLFSAFYAIGFFYLLHGGDQSIESSNSQVRLISYRVIQNIFQHTIGLLFIVTIGWKFALIYYLLWWFGVCDLLYYILLQQNFFKFGNLYWLSWTPFGLLVKANVVKDIRGTAMVVQASLGVIIAILALIYHMF